jgi:16S rRNA (uracil1498-N3)-methyltransferase
MTRRRWIADEASGNRAALIGDHARHLAQVLRARVGQEFDISAGGELRRGMITTLNYDRVEFELGAVLPKPKSCNITVAISIFKFDRMEWAIEKCAELGVARILPVIAGRTESHLVTAAGKRVERWRRIVKQASEQSRRVAPPEVSDPVKFKELLTAPSAKKIVLSENETEVSLNQALGDPAGSLILAFGPEGGWKPEEFAAFTDAGWASVSLGDTILRAETAVIAAVAIAASSFSQL